MLVKSLFLPRHCYLVSPTSPLLSIVPGTEMVKVKTSLLELCVHRYTRYVPPRSSQASPHVHLCMLGWGYFSIPAEPQQSNGSQVISHTVHLEPMHSEGLLWVTKPEEPWKKEFEQTRLTVARVFEAASCTLGSKQVILMVYGWRGLVTGLLTTAGDQFPGRGSQ